jgi:hypothetical protein
MVDARLRPPPEESEMNTADRLNSIELLEARSGETRALGSLWKDRPAVLIFLRHFG